jgi:uncharacterized protein (TIRG00374 family)
MEQEPSLKKRFFNLRTLLSFAIAIAIVVVVFLRMDINLEEVITNISHANLWLFLLAFVAYYLSFPVRALRWRILLGNVGFTKDTVKMPSMMGLLEIIMLSWFANCVIPVKLGDTVRGYFLKRRANISFTATMGTVVAERLMDMLMLFGLLVAAGLILFNGRVPDQIMYILLGGLVLVFAIALALVAIRLFSPSIAKRLPARYASIYSRFADATLLSFANLPAVGVLTLLVWILEAARFWIVCQSLGITQIGISAVIFLALANSLLTTVPLTPAGAGIVELMVVNVLIMLGDLGAIQDVSASLAMSVAILDRVVSYYSIIAFGLALLAWGMVRRMRRTMKNSADSLAS